MTSDLIIIGSGPGGYRAAAYAAAQGLTVTIIERGEVGGTCLNRGCIPTKTLCHHAELVDMLRKAGTFGISDLTFAIDFPAMMERKRQVVQTLRQGVETLMKAPGITLLKGTATFTDAHTVTVDGQTLTAPHIIIATGSKAKMLPIPGADSSIVVSSDQLLDTDAIPPRLCIIGAGVIGMEFASIFSSLGTKVTVVEYLKECLPMLDSDIAKRLRQTIARRGVDFIMQAAVKEIAPDGVVYERKGKMAKVETDKVLMATGRTPCTDGLCLEKAGIETAKGAIDTDEHLETNVKGVYAIGDVNGRQMLAHAATAQGLHVVDHIMQQQCPTPYSLVPAAIFTSPQAACVGMSEDDCKAQGTDYVCRKGYYRANGKAVATGETDGLVKLLEGADGRILGCHIYGDHAADMVQEVTALMACGATVGQLRHIIHIHPTLGEILQEVR